MAEDHRLDVAILVVIQQADDRTGRRPSASASALVTLLPAAAVRLSWLRLSAEGKKLARSIAGNLRSVTSPACSRECLVNRGIRNRFSGGKCVGFVELRLRHTDGEAGRRKAAPTRRCYPASAFKGSACAGAPRYFASDSPGRIREWPVDGPPRQIGCDNVFGGQSGFLGSRFRPLPRSFF